MPGLLLPLIATVAGSGPGNVVETVGERMRSAGRFRREHPGKFYGRAGAVVGVLAGLVTGCSQIDNGLPEITNTALTLSAEQSIEQIFTIEETPIIGAIGVSEGGGAGIFTQADISPSWDASLNLKAVRVDFRVEQELVLAAQNLLGIYDHKLNEYDIPISFGSLAVRSNVLNGSQTDDRVTEGLSRIGGALTSIFGENVNPLDLALTDEEATTFTQAAVLNGIQQFDAMCPPAYVPAAISLMEQTLNERYQGFAEGLRPGVEVNFHFVDVPEVVSPGDIPSISHTDENVFKRLESMGGMTTTGTDAEMATCEIPDQVTNQLRNMTDAVDTDDINTTSTGDTDNE